MTDVTSLLRQQLDHAHAANQSLSAELKKLETMRDEFDVREAEFKKEEQVRNTSNKFLILLNIFYYNMIYLTSTNDIVRLSLANGTSWMK